MERYYPEILRRYMGEERNGGSTNHDETTKSIAGICGGSQGSSSAAAEPEPVTREERSRYGEKVKPGEEAAMLAFASGKNWLISEKDFLSKYESRFIGSGAEQKVYLSEDGKHVLKVNGGRFHTTWLDYFNRLLFHAYLFPTTKYKTLGFTIDSGSFAVITEQRFAILRQGASREQVSGFLEQHGFSRYRNDDYYNPKIGVKLEDLHDENVFVDENGSLLFIDPVIYFETPDLKLGGEFIFRFPFEEA